MAEPFADEAERYRWAAGAIYSGRDCRSTLAKLKQWVMGAPK